MNMFRRTLAGGGSLVWEDKRGREARMKDKRGAEIKVKKSFVCLLQFNFIALL